MAGNRRSRGGNHHKKGGPNHNSNSNNNSNTDKLKTNGTARNDDGNILVQNVSIKEIHRASVPEEDETSEFVKILQEIEKNFLVTWKEVCFFLIAIMLLAFMSICVGVAAGMTISIHYYESYHPQVRGFHAMTRDVSSLYNGLNAHKRVTILDPHIAASNNVELQSLSTSSSSSTPHREVSTLLAKVITTSASGHLNVLMVVDEMPPLRSEGTFTNDNDDGGGSIYPGASNYHPQTSPNRSGGGEIWKDRNRFSGRYDDDGREVDNSQNIPPDPNRSDYERNAMINVRKPTVLPTLCSDGESYGFRSWRKLKAAVQEANALSAERFMKRNEYLAMYGDDSMPVDEYQFYEEDVYIPICPDTTLLGLRHPIFINSKNIRIECFGCTINAGGTHLAFGPHATNILVRGVTFRNAWSSSLTFYHNGADASFEDCAWIGNGGLYGKYGAVADVNSTSSITFFRCQVGNNRRGAGGPALPGIASALSLRT